MGNVVINEAHSDDVVVSISRVVSPKTRLAIEHLLSVEFGAGEITTKTDAEETPVEWAARRAREEDVKAARSAAARYDQFTPERRGADAVVRALTKRLKRGVKAGS